MHTQELTATQVMPFELADVSETGVLTLYCRAHESLSPDPILVDEKAVEITRALNPLLARSESKVLRDLSSGKVNPTLAVHITLRAQKYDQYARDFLAAHPDGVIVNLGCGLDSRWLRLNERRGIFFDLDLPEVIRVKRHFFQEDERYHLLGCSVFDYHWMDEIQSHGPHPVLFLAEGLFMYLDGEKVKDLILTLQTRFPGAELACEVVHQRWLSGLSARLVRFKMQGQLGIGREAIYHFGVSGSRALESWRAGIHFLEDWCYFDTNHPKLGPVRWFGKSSAIRQVQWTVHYRLD